MSLKNLHMIGKHIYFGKEKVGSIETSKNGIQTVNLNITYKTIGDWVLPLTGFATGISQLPEFQLRIPKADLEITIDKDDVEFFEDVPRMLNEVTIKLKGHKWQFHKNDVDDWPSKLHGHDYENNLKLDAITGNMYSGQERYVPGGKVNKKALKKIHKLLRSSKDFKNKANQLLPN